MSPESLLVAAEPGVGTAELSLTAASPRELVGALLELSKARLCTLVLMTTLAGYWLALPGVREPGSLLLTLVGTLMAAFGANSLNQCIEIDRDRRMKRTRRRPLPSGRLDLEFAWIYAISMATGGTMLLGIAVNLQTAILSAACTLIYVLVYTPMKTRSPSNTLVGAVCGAIPPMMGWTAAAGQLELGALALGGVLFFWQIPHFLALAWMYRDDYRDGGFCMLPVVDGDGGATCRTVILYSLMLIPSTLLLSLLGATGIVYAAGALLCGVYGVYLGIRMQQDRSVARARSVFLFSVLYLPILLVLMAVDRGAPAGSGPSAGWNRAASISALGPAR